MARDITTRLSRLNTRRKGLDSISRVTTDSAIDLVSKSLLRESWETRVATNRPYTRYALGAMQEVGPDYTRISIETAERVGSQLKAGLTALGYSVEFLLQGSVPANVHIKGVSDVDLLNLDVGFYTYATAGLKSQRGGYTTPTTKTSLGVLTSLRTESEKILKSKYPAATVDCSGGKAINISGGSLARPVDVVPAHWFDAIDYQQTFQLHDRGVTILNKAVPETIDNLPFLHIKRLGDADAMTLGGMKKAIRLCKSVKSDAVADGTTIALPSFDIAAIMYHADKRALQVGYQHELAILGEAQRFLDWLTTNEEEAKKLRVPDGSRAIFNTQQKLVALRALSVEMDDLMDEVAREQAPLIGSASRSWSDSRAALARSIIAAA